MKWQPALALANWVAAAATAVAGTVQTTDGKTYQGRVKLAAGKVVVEPAGGAPVRLDPASVVLATFDPAGTNAAVPAAAGQGFTAQYFSGPGLGRPVATRVEPAVDFNWGQAPPDPSITGPFLARWTAKLTPPRAATYTFTASYAGGVRVWVDGKPLIDAWAGPKVGETAAPVQLKAGKAYDVRVEYAHAGGEARLQLFWAAPDLPRQVVPAEVLTPAAPVVTGLRGEYFADNQFAHLLAARIDPEVSFAWPDDDHGPDPRVPRAFTARWTGRLTPDVTGNYRFLVRSQDPMRVWLNGQPIIDQVNAVHKHAPEHSERIALEAGHAYPIRVEYYGTGQQPAAAELLWSAPGLAAGAVQGAVPGSVPGWLLTPLPEHADPGPAVSFLSPATDAPVAAGRPTTVEVDAKPQPSPVAKVEVFFGRTSLGTATTRPYRVTWPAPPAGDSTLTAVAVDAHGVSGSARQHVLAAADAGTPLPGPWSRVDIGSPTGPAAFDFANGTFTAKAGHGEAASNADQLHALCAPLKDGGQVVARVASLTASVPGAYVVAGLFVRPGLRPENTTMTAYVSTEPTVVSGVRQHPGGPMQFVVKPGSAPYWLRLSRRGRAVAADFSPDGVRWSSLDTQTLPLGQAVYAGMFAAARDAGADCAAAFDHVSLGAGPPPPAYPASGLLFANGTFLPGDVREADDTTVKFGRPGRPEQSFPAAALARVIFRPMAREAADALPAGKAGLLMDAGDFLEAEVQSIQSGVVKTNSVVFGLASYAAGQQVTAVILRDVSPNPPPWEVRLADGSDWRCGKVTVENDHLKGDAGPAGAVDAAGGTVLEIRRNGP